MMFLLRHGQSVVYLKMFTEFLSSIQRCPVGRVAVEGDETLLNHVAGCLGVHGYSSSQAWDAGRLEE